MSRRTMNILGILILMGLSAIIGVLGYVYFVGGSGEASQPISVPTLDLSTPTPNALATEISSLSTQVAELQATNQALMSGGSPEATSEATAEAAVEATTEATTEAAASTSAVYQIVPAESLVSFTLTEELRGQPTTVVGKTTEVAGEILVDMGTPANSKVGVIRINARTLETDSDFRNRAIRGEILESSKSEYEFIDFTPTSISGLPASLSVGQEATFQVTGDLKIRDITQSVTFDVTATLASEDRLEGTAKVGVTRGQYDLVIPNAPGVANVSEDVTLQIDFVATKSA